MRGRGTGIALILMTVLAFLLAGFSLGQLGPTALASSSTTPSSLAAQTATQDNSLSGLVGNLTPTLAPSPTSTPAPTGALSVGVTPTSLTPRDCFQETLGYRCDLKLWLFTTTSHEAFTWQISGTIVLVHTTLKGNGTSAHSTQITIYIQPGQKGQIIFTFTFASHIYPASVTWEG